MNKKYLILSNSKKLFIVLLIGMLGIIGAVYYINNKNTKFYGPNDISIYDLKVNNQNPTIESSASEETSPKNEKGDAFTSKARQEFIDACVNKNQPSAVCACAADYIHNKYTPSEILNMYYEFKKANQIPAEVKSAIDSCKQ